MLKRSFIYKKNIFAKNLGIENLHDLTKKLWTKYLIVNRNPPAIHQFGYNPIQNTLFIYKRRSS